MSILNQYADNPFSFIKENRYAASFRSLHKILNDAWVINLRGNQNFEGRDNMFDREEMNFLQKTAISNLEEIDERIKYITMEMADLGGQLNKLYECKRTLQSISEKVDEAIKEDAA